MYKINEVSKKLGISVHTLRYYEREGLVHPLRDQNQRRIFTDDNIEGLIFVTKMRNTHMSISKIREYVSLYLQGDVTTQERRALLVEHLELIQSRISGLQEVEQYLFEKMEYFDSIHK